MRKSSLFNMDKTETEFETYEYLTTSNNVGTEPDQFFVLQEDGTFLLNKQVQYVAHVQDVKETLDGTQGCTVYDVPQQFFVDVTDNSAELISVADNYILSTPDSEEVSQIYSNSFLLQPVNSSNCDATKDLDEVQFKSPEDDVISVDKQGSNHCTEITLTDEQYKTLEQKGWVLLDACGKVYLLDTFGLHDITSNQELIQSLKSDSQINTIENTVPRLYEENETVLKLDLEKCDSQNIILKQEDNVKQFRVGSNQGNVEKTTEIYVDVEKEDQNATKLENEQPNESVEENTPDENINPEKPLQEYNVDRIKIVTKSIFKDIPDKMVLGKTKNGKRLVAKVIKKIGGPEKDFQRKLDTLPVVTAHKITSPDYDSECKKVFQLALCGEIEWTQADVAAASKIVHQLAQVPNVRASIDRRYVIITKVVEEATDAADGVTSCRRSYVTGFVTLVQGAPRLVHMPDLLHKRIRDTEDSSNRSLLKCQQTPADHKILQVHVSETRRDNCETISVLLNDQELPSKMSGMPQRLSRLHACSTCAAIFVSEPELVVHQENHAMDAEDTLTIDTDKLPKDSQAYAENNSYFQVKTDSGTEYGCLRCPKKFTKLIKCLRHKKIHDKPKKPDSDKEELHIDVQDPPFKCTMCRSQYYYASSLSKHICKAHITNNVKRVTQPYLISWEQ